MGRTVAHPEMHPQPFLFLPKEEPQEISKNVMKYSLGDPLSDKNIGLPGHFPIAIGGPC
jgi:hypothetical protein